MATSGLSIDGFHILSKIDEYDLVLFIIGRSMSRNTLILKAYRIDQKMILALKVISRQGISPEQVRLITLPSLKSTECIRVQ